MKMNYTNGFILLIHDEKILNFEVLENV